MVMAKRRRTAVATGFEVLRDMTEITEPGVEMFVLIHMGDEGLIPPPEDAPDGTLGKGSAHCFGPFVSRDEAKSWQEAMDTIRGGCACRVSVLPLRVPRILGIIGPAGIPMDVEIGGREERPN